MTGMYTRMLQKPKNSILLFGARGTGKSTWIRRHFDDAVIYNLLDTRESLRLERRPHILFNELESLNPETWVVLDEVQKVPALLDEVHRLIESRGLRFVLCGSSAHKLKRTGVNLLAGRAIVTHMFPLTSAELKEDFDVNRALVYGTLPIAITGEDPEGFLTTYTETYLNEEIRAEALTRNVGSFSRFLEIAARQNSQVTNITNIAREALVSRTTLHNYFEILVDTLIGYWVPAWKLKRATKQISHPKFYLFDTGIARALTGRLPYPPTQEELGHLFENMIFNEIKAYLSYNKLHYRVYFWRNYDGTEVDLLCETKNGFVAIEMKASYEWQKRFSRGLNRIQTELSPARVMCYGIYRGQRTAKFDNIEILPVTHFLEMLWNNNIIQ
ncbi:MAG: ATP-binding protein [Spirochaetes bacterium]|nr:ATP-binding protein [Spirochaetota bacterium]